MKKIIQYVPMLHIGGRDRGVLGIWFTDDSKKRSMSYKSLDAAIGRVMECKAHKDGKNYEYWIEKHTTTIEILSENGSEFVKKTPPYDGIKEETHESN